MEEFYIGHCLLKSSICLYHNTVMYDPIAQMLAAKLILSPRMYILRKCTVHK